MGTTPQSQSSSCQNCSRPLTDGGVYCPFCGIQTVPLPIDQQIQKIVVDELAKRLSDQNTMIRTLADKVEDTVWQRLKGYSWIVGILITVVIGALAFFGLTTINGASQKIEPIVQAGVSRAEAARRQVDQSIAKIDAVKTGIDKLSNALDEQTRRLNDKNADIGQKLASFNAAQTRIEAAEKRSETVARQVDAMGQALQTKVQQLSTQVDDITVKRAYPSLGQAMFVTLNGGAWKNKKEKKSGEFWVNVNISPVAMGYFSEAQIKQLLDVLKQDGYTPLLGTFGVGGPYSSGFSNLGDNMYANRVFYFSQDWRQKAETLSSLVSNVVSRSVPIEFLDPSKIAKDSALYFVLQESGLDAQIYLTQR